MDEELTLRLKKLAKRRKVGTSSMIREAVAEYVARAKPEQRPRLSFMGSVRSGHTDTAEKAEEILAEAAEETSRRSMRSG